MKIKSQNNFFLFLISFLILGMMSCSDTSHNEKKESTSIHTAVKPITGTWINLAYKDVRNKYTNPTVLDNTDPELWRTKVCELHKMGIEYLVLMEVANEGRAFYPSHIMDAWYDQTKCSPVTAILDEAGKYDMKVFMSTGWAKNQDDNLLNPDIKARQLEIMEELALVYKDKSAFWGWYLPVEDCINPIFPEHAVQSVNTLVEKAHSLTPGKKTMISPYGLCLSDFDNPKYESQLAKLKVDIIAYQDEVGCVREPLPLPKLRQNWKRLRDIHNRLNIELWANCETFTWENGTNDRNSALIPASYNRLLAQQTAASNAGVDRIISFMFYGIIENPKSKYQLGQPEESHMLYEHYMSWKAGNQYWKLAENALLGNLRNQCADILVKGLNSSSNMLFDNELAEENSKDSRWQHLGTGYQCIDIDLKNPVPVKSLMVRTLNYNKESIGLTGKVSLSVSDDAENYRLLSLKEIEGSSNDKHDAWIEHLLFDKLSISTRYVRLEFQSEKEVLVDEIFVNPYIE